MDAREIRDFYARPLGALVRRLLAARLRARWRQSAGMTVIGLGFATPYMGMFSNNGTVASAFMPAGQGAIAWPAQAPVRTVLVDADRMPLEDASVDRLLAVHCLEHAEAARPLLREIWRVLKPEGRFIMVVPNRRSIWARVDSTPFGHGRPYSHGQLKRLLEAALFTPLEWSGALHVPPWELRMLMRSAPFWERAGAAALPAFCGAIIVESTKELVAPVGKGARARGLREAVTITGSP